MSVRALHFAETPSTMDAARAEAGDCDFLLVTAERQSKGRGTKGRPWLSPTGNLYMTLAVARRLLPPPRLRILPLEAGLWLWECVAEALAPPLRLQLRLKWPNDLLWKGRKAAGMLMESAGAHVLLGVGINLETAPRVDDGGTPSKRLLEAGLGAEQGLPLARHFMRLAQQRLELPSPEDVVAAWCAKARWNTPFRLRDRPQRPQVMPLELNHDGHLRVRFEDGREEWLVSEYLA